MPVKISLVTLQGQFVGGKVDLDFVPRAAKRKFAPNAAA